MTITGTVKWYNRPHGYGFLVSPDVPADIFIHATALVRGGWHFIEPWWTVKAEVHRVNGRWRVDRVLEVRTPENRGTLA
jgi:cold shock CspA family protein